ncbi:MAG: tripartite tricarboxylate transporter permease [Candidatus Rokubacteria bacterium]|nr:tripartite tricarboxylate transporter permease [Candidatus Rokubacteria bacterium]
MSRTVKLFPGRPFLLLRSTVIGVWIGVLPAIGGSAANVMAYDQAKKFSRHPEKFGTGIPEGVTPVRSPRARASGTRRRPR